MWQQLGVDHGIGTGVSGEFASWSRLPDGVWRVDLHHPPANALGLPLVDGLIDALDRIEDEGPVRAVVIASAVPRFFAAGADIKFMAQTSAEGFARYGARLRTSLDSVAASPYPVVAAIEGLALGGGLELALACTMRVGGRDARLGLPEVKLGLIPGAGGTQRLPRVVGRGHALDIMLTGRQVPAEEAWQMGLLDRLVEPGDAVDVALDLAAELAATSLPAQRAVVRAVDAAFEQPLEEGLRYEAEQVQELFEHGEAGEGIAAFVGKRAPKFERA